MAFTIGTKVVRTVKDNFPCCEVGAIGTITSDPFPMGKDVFVMVDFGKDSFMMAGRLYRGPEYNDTRYLEEVDHD